MPHLKVIGKAIRELGREVLEEAIAREVVEGARNAAGEAGKKTAERYFKDPRGHLLTIFAEMEKEGEEIANLRRRHKEAIERGDENRFVTLLSKLISEPLPKKPEEGRGRRRIPRPTTPRVADARAKKALKWLNDMEDEEFNQFLEFLRHNVVQQDLQRLKKAFEAWWTSQNIVRRTGKAIDKAAERAAVPTANALNGLVNSLADFHARQQERRRRR